MIRIIRPSDQHQQRPCPPHPRPHPYYFFLIRFAQITWVAMDDLKKLEIWQKPEKSHPCTHAHAHTHKDIVDIFLKEK